MRDMAPAIAASIAIHLLVIGLIGFTWSSEPELHRAPKIPPYVTAMVLEKEKPAEKPVAKPKPKPAAKPKPKPAPKPAPKPVPKPADKPAPPKPAEPKPTFKQPSLAEMLAEEELQLEQQVEDEVEAPEDTGPSEAEQAEMASYEQAIIAAINSRWILPGSLQAQDGLVVEVVIRTLPGGEVVDVGVRKSSGYPVLDDSALNAVRKASPLPVPSGSGYDNFRSFGIRMVPKFSRSE